MSRRSKTRATKSRGASKSQAHSVSRSPQLRGSCGISDQAARRKQADGTRSVPVTFVPNRRECSSDVDRAIGSHSTRTGESPGRGLTAHVIAGQFRQSRLKTFHTRFGGSLINPSGGGPVRNVGVRFKGRTFKATSLDMSCVFGKNRHLGCVCRRRDLLFCISSPPNTKTISESR